MTTIYNNSHNLRVTVDDETVHSTLVGTHQYFTVVRCEDYALGKWNKHKVYCGIISSRDDYHGIQQIMNDGNKPHWLRDWLNEYG